MINCVCHSRYSVFRVLGIYNFDSGHGTFADVIVGRPTTSTSHSFYTKDLVCFLQSNQDTLRSITFQFLRSPGIQGYVDTQIQYRPINAHFLLWVIIAQLKSSMCATWDEIKFEVHYTLMSQKLKKLKEEDSLPLGPCAANIYYSSILHAFSKSESHLPSHQPHTYLQPQP